MALFREKPLIWVTCFFAIRRLFKSGELGTRIDLWEKILEGHEMTKDVLEWSEHGVGI